MECQQDQRKTYQIPRGSMPLSDTIYSFSASFLKDYNLTLNEQEITSMTPEEVVDFLFPYFEDNRLLDKKYYLTSADDLSLGNCNYYKLSAAFAWLFGFQSRCRPGKW